MRVIYTGKQEELTAAQQKKLAARFAKLGKLLDRKEEKEAHVFLNSERFLHRVEITLNYYDHPLAGAGSAPDQFSAIVGALEKLEKQVLKVRARWRDSKRDPRASRPSPAAASPAVAAGEGAEGRVFRVNHRPARKPMTLEEAVIEMERDRDYLVYRDAETDRLSVLLRRRDGNFDLIEV